MLDNPEFASIEQESEKMMSFQQFAEIFKTADPYERDNVVRAYVEQHFQKELQKAAPPLISLEEMKKRIASGEITSYTQEDIEFLEDTEHDRISVEADGQQEVKEEKANIHFYEKQHAVLVAESVDPNVLSAMYHQCDNQERIFRNIGILQSFLDMDAMKDDFGADHDARRRWRGRRENTPEQAKRLAEVYETRNMLKGNIHTKVSSSVFSLGAAIIKDNPTLAEELKLRSMMLVRFREGYIPDFYRDLDDKGKVAVSRIFMGEVATTLNKVLQPHEGAAQGIQQRTVKLL